MTDLANNLQIITTADGSQSLLRTDLGETYHSRLGALTESKHVFIKNGLELINLPKINVLEIGYGTGLNAYVAALYSQKNNIPITYTGLELHPLPAQFIQLPALENVILPLIIESPFNTNTNIHKNFELIKIQCNALTYPLHTNQYDCIFFDAFAPNYQSEMWEMAFFQKLFLSLKNGGILSTYCAQGQVRRDLIACGFNVQKVAGPPGKREMIIAHKI